MKDDLFARAEAWRRADPDPVTAAELSALIEKRDQAELADRFAGTLSFGTAGLRGVIGAGPNRMNRAVVRRATAGLARYLLAQVPDARARGVAVGRDGRRMSPEFLEDTCAVLAAQGIPAFSLGVVPTPVTAFATLRLGVAASVMITASHNPPEYNGYKVYWGNGAQIIPPHDQGIAAEIDRVGPANEIPLAPGASAAVDAAELERAYLDAILALRLHGRAEGLGIVYSALHGVGGRFVLAALREAGFQRVHAVAEQQEPDGAFPTVRFPNPEEPGAMDLSIALAERTGADLVLANDPDADRLAVLARDRTSALRPLGGNEVGVLLGHYCLTRRRVPKPLVITTIVSSPQLGVIARDLGALYDETLTGFKWIANRAMERERAEGATFVMGYEEALGYTVGTVVRDKDGVGSALVFADLAAWCRSRGVTVHDYLEEIQREHGLFVAAQRNFTFPGAEGAAVIAKIMDGFRARPPSVIGGLPVVEVKDYREGVPGFPKANVIAYELPAGSRVTLRPSGTEPKIKYYFDLRGDAADPAGARARLAQLIDDFLTLARDRGQPA